MTDFAIRRSHKCRTCETGLDTPTANKREQFCCRGCHTAFYRKRCRVCENPIEQPRRGERLICNRAECRSALRAGVGLGRYHTPKSAESLSEVPDSIGPNQASKADRPWRQVAGPALSSSAFHCATVPDGPAGWAGGEYLRIEAKNEAALKAAFTAGAVIIPAGTPSPVAGADGRGRIEAPLQRGELAIPADLSIPEVLRRTRRPGWTSIGNELDRSPENPVALLQEKAGLVPEADQINPVMKGNDQ